jgi:hypothetical protein
VDIIAWLQSLGLRPHAKTFRNNEIGANTLSDLTEIDVERLSTPFGHPAARAAKARRVRVLMLSRRKAGCVRTGALGIAVAAIVTASVGPVALAQEKLTVRLDFLPWGVHAALMRVRFPHALPIMFAGMKVAISLALVGAIVGESVAGASGLGQLILVAQGQFATPRVFVSLVVLGMMGIALFYLIDLAERLMLPWHVSQRALIAPPQA